MVIQCRRGPFTSGALNPYMSSQYSRSNTFFLTHVLEAAAHTWGK